MSSAPSIQSVPPSRVITVADGHELAEAVRACGESGQAICDYGNGCGGLGHAPPSDYVRIEMPGGVIAHDRADFTLRVRAATTIAELRRTLQTTGQFLPLDGLHDQQTIGEAVAHNLYGTLRLSYGALRDLLLGLSFVDGTGRRVRAGGRTVKNVAGLDLVRLMVGSMNTLGLLEELTLRTYPQPPGITQIALVDFDPTLLDEHANALLTGNGAPWYLDWHNAPNETGTLHIAYAGSSAARNAGCAGLIKWLKSVGWPTDHLDSRDVSPQEDEAIRNARRTWRQSAEAVVKLIVPPAQTGATLARLGEPARGECTLNALPIHGVIHMGGSVSLNRARRWHQAIEESAALWLWFKRPQDSPKLPSIGPRQNDWPMLGRIKQEFDPKHILNPARTPWASSD